MIDENRSGAEAQSNENSAAALPASPGAILRKAREAAGVSVEALAGAMKVPSNKIEGLESDNYAALPDVIFARALAASICRIFGISSAPVLALMPKGGAHSLASTAADINATFKDGSERPRRNSVIAHATRPLGVAVVVLLLGAAVFVLLPYRNDSPESAGTGSITYQPTAPDLPLEMAPPAESGLDGLVPPPDAGAPSVQWGRSGPQALAEGVGGTPESAASMPSPSNVLEFTARGPSWVQVRDASKKVVFERTLAKGEIASATGMPPLRVVVGRADVIDVKVRGAQFELAGVAKDNIARFEVQ